MNEATAVEQIAHEAAQIIAPPAKAVDLVPATVKAADFTSGTDGRVRQTWQRLLGQGAHGHGWNAFGGAMYSLAGGKPARESFKAAGIITEIVSSNPTLSTIVDTIVTHGVGNGLTLSAKPSAKLLGISADEARDIADQLETHFNDWACDSASVDRSGRYDLHTYAQLAFRNFALTGESFVVWDWRARPNASSRTCMELLDSRQIAPEITRQMDGARNVFQGVVFDSRGKWVGVMARDLPMGSYVSQPIAQFIPAYTGWGRPKVSHLFMPVDPRQVRGLSPIVASITALLERETISEFEVVAALIQTMFGVSLESQLPPAEALNALRANDDLSVVDGFLALKEQWYESNKIRLEPGQISVLAPSVKLTFHRNEHPNSTFKDFDKSLANKAARAAGMEAAEVRGDYSDTSFSAAKLAGETPYRLNLMRRRAIVEKLYHTAYHCLAEELIESGKIKLPRNAPPFQENKRAYLAADFHGWGRISPDPKKDMERYVLGLTNGILSLTGVLAEQGEDFDTHVALLDSERKRLGAKNLNHPFFAGSTSTQSRDEKIEEEKDGKTDPAAESFDGEIEL